MGLSIRVRAHECYSFQRLFSKHKTDSGGERNLFLPPPMCVTVMVIVLISKNLFKNLIQESGELYAKGA